MSLNVVLVKPEIPQNTGNISCTCVVAGCSLHIVKPMGFSLSEKYTRRAGLDYWKDLSLFVYENMEDFYSQNSGAECWYFSSKAKRVFSQAEYRDGCFLVFGNETSGLERGVTAGKEARCVRIPMLAEQRCLNLSNAVSVALYEALRQNDYPSLV
jgi:tRNA (cytidine/uridine-2'-O-)-methyltransferase